MSERNRSCKNCAFSEDWSKCGYLIGHNIPSITSIASICKHYAKRVEKCGAPVTFENAWGVYAEGYSPATEDFRIEACRLAGLAMWRARGKADVCVITTPRMTKDESLSSLANTSIAPRINPNIAMERICKLDATEQ